MMQVLYLRSLSDENKNSGLKSADRDLSLEYFVESSVAGYDVYLYKSDSLNYDAVKSNFSFTAGVNADFLKIFYRHILLYYFFQKQELRIRHLILPGWI